MTFANRNMGMITTSGDAERNTPANIVRLVHRLYGGVDLDPCHNATSIVGARYVYTIEDDGLVQPWFGRVYVNPPYDRKRSLMKWARKVVAERERYAEAVTLTPARTDTEWFTVLREGSAALCFWRGRLKFLGCADLAPFPSMLAYFGPRPQRFRAVFAPYGWLP